MLLEQIWLSLSEFAKFAVIITIGLLLHLFIVLGWGAEFGYTFLGIERQNLSKKKGSGCQEWKSKEGND